MVNRWLVFTAMIFLVNSVHAGVANADRIAVELPDGPAELGRPITIRLKSIHTGVLDKIDLSPLEADFAIHNEGTVVRDAQRRIYLRQLQLYPRHQGRISIPALGDGSRASVAQSIDVSPAVDRKDGSRIGMHTEISSQALWLKQGFRVTVVIETDSEIVDIELPVLDSSGFESLTLPLETRSDSARPGRTVHRLGWVIHPLTTGPQQLRLPSIAFKRDGIVTHRFFPPLYPIEVNPLPGYIPVTLPVGKISYHADPVSWIPVTRGQLNELTFRIDAAGMPSQFADFLSDQLVSTDSTAIYPAEIGTGNKFNSSGAISQLHYRIPFVPTGIGLVRLPTIRIQYFDPTTGTIMTRQHALGTVLSIPRWIQVLLVTASLATLAYLLLLAARETRAYWRRLSAYRSAAQRIRAAVSAQDIKAALADIAGAETWPANLTVDRWLRRWSRQFDRGEPLVECLHQLQANLYGKANTSLDAIQATLLRACYQRQPLLRIVDSTGRQK